MIYIFCEACHKIYFLDYIKSISVNYKNKITYINQIRDIRYVKTGDVLIFIKNIPYGWKPPSQKPTYKIYLLNTEQMTKPDIIRNIENIPANIEIIDYSLENIRHLMKMGKRTHYLPYMINLSEILNLPKTEDIAVIGWWRSEYRMRILYELALLGIEFHHIEGFDSKRDRELFSHRILLNVHFNETYGIMEQMRCNRCIFNRMIVISEKSEDIDYELRPYMIECEYSEIPQKTKDVLENYEIYYEKLFANFDLDVIEQHYKKIADEVIENIGMK